MGSELDQGVVDGVGGRTEFHSDGVHLEFWFRNIPELVAEDCVPLQTVAMEQNVNLKLNNMFPIDDVAREAFAVLGQNH